MQRGAPRAADRLIEAYWSGLVSWALQRTEPGWWPSRRRLELDRLRHAVLDVGVALVDMRHGRADPLALALDRLRWWIDLCEARSALAPADLARLRAGISAVEGLGVAEARRSPYNAPDAR